MAHREAQALHECRASTPLAPLQRFMAIATDQQNTWMTATLIDKLLTLNANDARAYIEEAFRRTVVDEEYASLKCAQRYLRPNQPAWFDNEVHLRKCT
jgi:hypothetical protein